MKFELKIGFTMLHIEIYHGPKNQRPYMDPVDLVDEEMYCKYCKNCKKGEGRERFAF
jgi:hypothetical protein